MPVPKPRPCACCSSHLEPAQELRFLVETDNLDNPAHLSRIRRLPAVNGRPVPVCFSCQNLVQDSHWADSRPRTAYTCLLAAVGLLTMGWMVQNLVFGSRA